MNRWIFRRYLICGTLALCASSLGLVRADILDVQVHQGHTYFLLTTNTWTGSQDEAVTLGGNLVTVNDQAEQNFLYTTFAFDPAKYLWIGLNDAGSNGNYTWISGEPVSYTNWAAGEPTNGKGEDYAYISAPVDPRPEQWNDIDNSPQLNGLVEVNSLPSRLLDISTRLNVLDGGNVLIGGFIVTGTEPKRILLRGIGPSLGNFGVSGFLVDPLLELHNPGGSVVLNDNWRDTQEAEIQGTSIPPTHDLEAAILATLDPGFYTAVLRGNDGGIGIGLVEAYDLDLVADSTLANISTRGFIQTGDDVLIGGFIAGGGSVARVVLRAIGPSLSGTGVMNAMTDPDLELRDSEGTVVASNDNWMDGPDQQAIADAGLGPTQDAESAILANLRPGAYTGIVSGVGKTTGVGLFECYNLLP